MNIYEGFTCPRCKSNSVSLQNANILMSDVMINNIACSECGCQWRMYVKSAEVNVEVTALPEVAVPELISEDAAEVEIVPAEDAE